MPPVSLGDTSFHFSSENISKDAVMDSVHQIIQGSPASENNVWSGKPNINILILIINTNIYTNI